MHQFTSMSSISPSFTSYSSNDLSDIAARVVAEFRNDNSENDIYNFLDIEPDIEEESNKKEEKEKEDQSDEEFEFEVLCKESNSLNISADEIFYNGEIIPRYPLFDQSLLNEDVLVSDSIQFPVVNRKRNQLRKLFNEERETPSCSSSETDDLDGVSPETYCIWKPKEESPEICKKSNSTGNISKRWKLRNLLRRSNSDRNFSASKDEFVLKKTAKVAGTDDDAEPATVVETDKIDNRLRSVSFTKSVFANVNGLSRNLHPF